MVFVDKFVTCSLNPAKLDKLVSNGWELVKLAKEVQTHRHTRTCHKYDNSCRFHKPSFPMKETTLFESKIQIEGPDEEETKDNDDDDDDDHVADDDNDDDYDGDDDDDYDDDSNICDDLFAGVSSSLRPIIACLMRINAKPPKMHH